jgi:integrase
VPKEQGVASERGHNSDRKRLTARRVATLGPGDHTDPSTQGLQLRVREKATGMSRTWLFRYRWRGEWVRLTFGHYPGTDLVEARETANSLRKKIDEGIDPRRSRPKRTPKASPLPLSAAVSSSDKHSVEFLVSEFTARHLRATRKRPEQAERILQKDILPEWMGRDARTIEPHEVIELLDKIVDRGSLVMANRVATILTQLFKFGIHRRIVKTSPVQLLYRPGGKEKPRERTLTDDELKVFLRDPKAATRFQRLASAMTILLLTGQRRGELAFARWAEIDFEKNIWTIPPEHSKTGRGHVVPLSDWAVREFEALKRIAKRSAYVLPANGGSKPIDPKQLTRGVARCQTRMQELGIDSFTLHDLRRTCRTGLSRLKIQPHIAERVLNHVQERIAGTYDLWAYADEKRDALNKWAAHLQMLAELP